MTRVGVLSLLLGCSLIADRSDYTFDRTPECTVDSECPDVDRATRRCVDQVCTVECQDGFGNCDDDATNGCETSLVEPSSCGACDIACEGETPICAPGEPASCQAGCPDPLTECGGSCIDVTTDRDNCGSCGNACEPGQTCESSECASCPDGFGDCDALVEGCETSLESNDACGACGVTCVGVCRQGECLDIVQSDGGHFTTCAVLSNNHVYCWGANGVNGQLGAGDVNRPRGVPHRIDNPATPGTPFLAVHVAVGFNHACVIDMGGDVWCWGRNVEGQCGDGTEESVRTRPVPVAGASSGFDSLTFVQLATSTNTTCALADDGTMWCWGANENGEISGQTGLFRSAVRGAGTALTDISMGSNHACGVRDADGDNQVYCWGTNTHGQIGVGNTAFVDRIQATGLPNVTRVWAGSEFTCALGTAGEAYCWGLNDEGQVGNGMRGTDQLVPTRVQAAPLVDMDAVQELVLLDETACARADDQVRCWGGNLNGELASGEIGTGREYAELSTFPGDVEVFSSGARHACALIDGALQCWGRNNQGQLGRSEATVTVPAAQVDVTGVSQAAAGHRFGCAQNADGLWCWGWNANSRSARSHPPGITQSAVPERIGEAPSSLGLGNNFACAIDSAGQVTCWGANLNRQLGVDSGSTPVPQEVENVGAATALATGWGHACAIAGNVWCWGDGRLGQAGAPSGDQVAPRDLGFVAESIVAGAGFTCALVGGNARCWGSNDDGQLGDGTTNSSETPVDVDTDQTFRELSAGAGHVCGITTSDELYCWGENTSGQIGNDSRDDQRTPVRVIGDVQSVATGDDHTCITTRSNAVLCWGYSGYGALGQAPRVDRQNPTMIEGLVATQVFAGPRASQTLAVTPEGQLLCFGVNLEGACGGGEPLYFGTLAPVDFHAVGVP